MTTTATTIAAIIANIHRQSRTGRAVWLTAEAAQTLLEYIAALEVRLDKAQAVLDAAENLDPHIMCGLMDEYGWQEVAS